MPQLDTIYIFTTYLWTWLIMYLMTQKTKTFLMTSTPRKHNTTSKPTPPQWP